MKTPRLIFQLFRVACFDSRPFAENLGIVKAVPLGRIALQITPERKENSNGAQFVNVPGFFRRRVTCARARAYFFAMYPF